MSSWARASAVISGIVLGSLLVLLPGLLLMLALIVAVLGTLVVWLIGIVDLIGSRPAQPRDFGSSDEPWL